MLEIKSTQIQNEQNLVTNLEKENYKSMNQMTSQISTLKQAIGTLADAVSDELESFKRSFFVDLD